jgi:UDP-4-amino-4,6-dideoxy-N-acetyl-beta-L-altrosamine transaminase
MLPYGQQWITDEDIREVIRVLENEWITTGPKVGEFEQSLCNYIKCKYAVAVNSGTSGLDIALQALDFPAGSEIITTPFTFMATSNAILYNRCTPVFADIKKETRNLDPSEIRRKITDKTQAIIFVDFAGHPCDMIEIQEIAEEHNLALIDDACHALGAKYHNRKVGTFADMTVFSFHPVKHITTGEGGAVVTNSEKLYQNMCMLRNHGIDKSALERHLSDSAWAYDMKFLGKNYRITDFQAALGNSQLKRLDEFIKRRRHLAGYYTELLQEVPGLELPVILPRVHHAWHLYTVLIKHGARDAVFRQLRKEGIGVNVHYIPVYRFSYYRKNFPADPKNFPITETVYKEIITLPLFPKMDDKDVLRVVRSLKTALSSDPGGAT